MIEAHSSAAQNKINCIVTDKMTLDVWEAKEFFKDLVIVNS